MIIIGHRGAKDLAPENTLASIRKALDCGVDAIEVDVRVTKDGACILHHDPFIIKDLEHEYWISHHTYTQLKKIDPDLATLDEAVKLVKRRVPFFVEIKPGVPTDPVVDSIRLYLRSGWLPSDFIFVSFSQSILKELKTEFPQIPLAVTERWSVIRVVRRAKELNTKHICLIHRFLWGGLIFALSRRGYKIYAYPLNNPAKAKKWARYGLAGVFTDTPDRFQTKV
jgi:glycerophosphoryl diester phosphodiesterase